MSGDKYQYETEIKAFFKETKRRNDNTSKLKKVIYFIYLIVNWGVKKRV